MDKIMEMAYKVTLTKDLSNDILNILNRDKIYTGKKNKGDVFKIYCGKGYRGDYYKTGIPVPEWVTIKGFDEETHLFCLLGENSDYFKIEIDNSSLLDLGCPKCGETKCTLTTNFFNETGDKGYRFPAVKLKIQYACGHSREIKLGGE